MQNKTALVLALIVALGALVSSGHGDIYFQSPTCEYQWVAGDTFAVQFSVDYYDPATGKPIEYFRDGARAETEPGFEGHEMHARVAKDDEGYGHVVYMYRSRFQGNWRTVYAVFNSVGDYLLSRRVHGEVGLDNAYPAIALDSEKDAHITWCKEMDDGSHETYYRKMRFVPDTLHPQNSRIDTLTPPIPISSVDGINSARWIDPLEDSFLPPTDGLKGGLPPHQEDTDDEISTPVWVDNIPYIEHPDISVDGDDNVHIVWSQISDMVLTERNGQQQITNGGRSYWAIYYQKQTSDGTVLVDDKRISNIPRAGCSYHSTNPAISADTFGNVHIVWQGLQFDEETPHWERFYEMIRSNGNIQVDDYLIGQVPEPDIYNSVCPDIEVLPYTGTSILMSTLLFMDDRREDPGHEGEETHVPGQYETFTACYISESPTLLYLLYSKRQSDMCYKWPLYPENWFGEYCPANTGDGFSLFPRMAMSASPTDPGTKIVWFDGRVGSGIYFTEIPNFENYVHSDEAVTTGTTPSAYPDIGVDNLSGHPGIAYQEWNGEDWDLWYKHWDDLQKMKVVVVTEEDTLHYDLYRTEPSDTDATDGITYLWQMNLTGGNYTYHFEAMNEQGYEAATIEEEVELSVKGDNPFSRPVADVTPGLYAAAFPNPVTTSTDISFILPADGHVHLEIYNSAGQLIETLIDEPVVAGCHQVNWKPQNIASGVYFYRLSGGEKVATKKITVLR